MIKSRSISLAVGGALGLVLAAQPLSISLSLGMKPALALANQGGGKGGGGAGGQGGGGGAAGGHTGTSAGSASAASMGRENADHASAKALAHAAPNSAVGRVAAYKAALGDATVTPRDIAAAAAALVALSNKPITLASVHALDTRLGLTAMGMTAEQAVVDAARALLASRTARQP